MYRLTRAVRFSINPRGVSRERGGSGYSGNPPPRALAPSFELIVDCVGEAGASTSYVINIKEIDRAVRESILPVLERACDEHPERSPVELMPDIVRAASTALPGLVDRLRWNLSPYHGIEMNAKDLSRVVLRQKFDFCAAHRLHNSALSPGENVALFGKCNNASGHGHNYQIEPAVSVPIVAGGRAFTLEQLERLVEREIIQRFDHRNLNTDTVEFKEGTGAMPSVEQISRVCFELLARALQRESAQASLQSVQVWESDRTSSTYPA